MLFEDGLKERLLEIVVGNGGRQLSIVKASDQIEIVTLLGGG